MRADRRQFLRDSLWTMSTLMGSPGLLAAAREEPAASPVGGGPPVPRFGAHRRRAKPPASDPPANAPAQADRDRGRGQVFPAVRQRAPRPADQAVPNVVQRRRRRHASPTSATWNRMTASASSARIASSRTRAASRSDSAPTSSTTGPIPPTRAVATSWRGRTADCSPQPRPTG